MWYSPEKYDKEFQNLNDQFLALKGELEDKEAKISLAKFLRANLGFTTELISGIKLAAYQPKLVSVKIISRLRDLCCQNWSTEMDT